MDKPRHDYPAAPCPKCGRMLPADGELAFGGVCVPTYCCPECVNRATVFGKVMELPLIFVIGPDGQAYDPASPDGRIDLTPLDD